jgi:hypothetical protein
VRAELTVVELRDQIQLSALQGNRFVFVEIGNGSG